QAVKKAARPSRDIGVPDDFCVHVWIQTTLADAIVDADSDHVVAGVEEFLDIENRLCLPVVRLADEVAVHEVPALVVASRETNLSSGTIQVLFCKREMRPIDRHGVRSFDCQFTA